MKNHDQDPNKPREFWNLGDVFFEIGNSFFEGKDCPEDNSLAAIWFGLAAASGHGGAHVNLGLMLGEGRGVPTRFHWALNVAGVIAKQGDEQAMKAVEQILLLEKFNFGDAGSTVH